MPSTYELIKGETTTSNASSYTFTAIPSTFTDLVLRTSIRSQYTGAVDFNITINGDTSSTLYSSTVLYAFGGSPASAKYSGRNQWEAQNSLQSNSATANTFGSIELYVPNYTVAANKVGSLSIVAEDNAAGFAGSGSGNAMVGTAAHLWRNTAAITSISVASPFLSGSSFYLYGVKNA
jgi:hypothetical protein